MSAVFNNIKTMSDVDLDRQRKNDRIDPAIAHAFDIEYRMRQLENHVFEQYTGAEQEQESSDTVEGGDQDTVSGEVGADPEEDTDPYEDRIVPAYVHQILRHYEDGHIVESDQGFYAISGEPLVIMDEETGDPVDQRLTPVFETEKEVWDWFENNKDKYLETTVETFQFFWEEAEEVSDDN
jgi:hypothetical protein